jgi:S1-C subfamily serine protease
MRSTVPLTQLAALAAAGIVGGVVALGAASLVDESEGSKTVTVAGTGPAAAQGVSRALGVNGIYRRSAPGVVQIASRSAARVGTDPAFGAPFQTPGLRALGSGFVIDKDGHVVTNFHVIEGASDIEVGFSKGDTVKATVVGSDPSTDLAVLKLETRSRALTPLPLGNSDEVDVGDPVVAIGNPFGLERTVTAGIVSALQRAVTAPNGFTIDHVIQTDAPISSGSSGGPLLNERGDVIGVNSQIETGTVATGNVGIGFAVPSNTVKSVVAQLLQKGKVERAYIGVAVTEITPELKRLFRLPVAEGLLIERVQPGSPAAKAGIRGGGSDVLLAGEGYRLGGDVVVAAAGQPVDAVSDLRDVLARREPGDTIELELYRGGSKKTVRVELGRQPTSPRG